MQSERLGKNRLAFTDVAKALITEQFFCPGIEPTRCSEPCSQLQTLLKAILKNGFFPGCWLIHNYAGKFFKMQRCKIEINGAHPPVLTFCHDALTRGAPANAEHSPVLGDGTFGKSSEASLRKKRPAVKRSQRASHREGKNDRTVRGSRCLA